MGMWSVDRKPRAMQKAGPDLQGALRMARMGLKHRHHPAHRAAAWAILMPLSAARWAHLSSARAKAQQRCQITACTTQGTAA